MLQTYKETTGRDSWSSLYDAPIYDSEKGKSYLILSPQETSEDSGSFRHIGLVDTTQVCSLNQNLRVRGGAQKRAEGGGGLGLPRFGTTKTSTFTNTQSKFALVVLDGVLGTLRPA